MGLFDRFLGGTDDEGQKRLPSPFGPLDPFNKAASEAYYGKVGPISDTSGARPDYPLYTSLLDPEGRLKSQYLLKGEGDVGFTSNLADLDAKLQGIQLNKEGLEAIRKRALTAGPSEWANLMTQKQQLEEATARDSAAAGEAGARSEALSNLARTGGLSSGARERLQTSGARNLAGSLQQLAREGRSNRLGILTEDERSKLDLLKGLPGMEINALAPELEKTKLRSGLAETEAARNQNLNLSNRDYRTAVQEKNLANTLGEVGRGDASRLTAYTEQMKAYAAAKQADALANSNRSSGGKK